MRKVREMFCNEKKTIGVFAERALSEFQNKLCQGISAGAEKLGYNVVIFSSYGNYGHNARYFIGEQKLYDLPPYEKLDGVIVALDTMDEKESRDKILKNVREKCNCPIVSVREVIQDANNLLVDNTTCMEGVIKHFVEEHKFTRLSFMTGPEDRWDARERLVCFERVMEEYHLPVCENQKFYGDFWKNKGGEACDWFLQQEEVPQAIICSNDYMAESVASELIGRGYRIPDDICVSGYDGVSSSMAFTPSITTMMVPFFEMGERAVEIIHEKQECPEKIDDYYFEAQVIARESCGCQKQDDYEVIRVRRELYEEGKVEENRQLQFDFMSINLGEIFTMGGIADMISRYIYNVENFSDYALCLNPNLLEREDFSDYDDTMELRIAFCNRRNMGELRLPYDKKELLPSLMTDDDRPQIWYFAPIHFQDKCFGFEAFRFYPKGETGKLYQPWNIVLSNQIQDAILNCKLQDAISELEYMYDRDALTGLYNRRGLESRGNKIFAKNIQKGRPVFHAVIDLDGMKQINDNYGHPEGDFALKKVTEALESISGENVICARTGGDEFVVLASNITEEQGVEKVREVEKYLSDFNASKEKEYNIYASVGYVCRVPKPEENMETFTRESDEVMYKNKVANKTKRGEPLR